MESLARAQSQSLRNLGVLCDFLVTRRGTRCFEWDLLVLPLTQCSRAATKTASGERGNTEPRSGSDRVNLIITGRLGKQTGSLPLLGSVFAYRYEKLSHENKKLRTCYNRGGTEKVPVETLCSSASY
jgi:hypothetical protein